MTQLRAGWNAFWFTPRSTLPLAFLRIAFGLLVAVWAFSLRGDVAWFFGPDGIQPSQPDRPGVLALLRHLNTTWAAYVFVVGVGLAGLALAVGLRSKVAGWVVFVGLVSLQYRNPYVVNGGDLLMRLVAVYVALAPTGAALSYDRWRRHRADFWQAPERPLWAVRLLQVQVCVMYFDSVWEKIVGETWRRGTAVGFALANDALTRSDAVDWITGTGWLDNLLTWATLVLELALVFLVWNRRLRPWVLLGGVALHLGIEIGMPLGFFPLVVMVSYLSFVPVEWAEKVLAPVRATFDRRGGRRPARAVAARRHARPDTP
ncbi:MAG: HTTM domain-containing protein [Acidimicrobiia bacterium]